jgi:hypothetical protein
MLIIMQLSHAWCLLAFQDSGLDARCDRHPGKTQLLGATQLLGMIMQETNIVIVDTFQTHSLCLCSVAVRTVMYTHSRTQLVPVCTRSALAPAAWEHVPSFAVKGFRYLLGNSPPNFLLFKRVR